MTGTLAVGTFFTFFSTLLSLHFIYQIMQDIDLLNEEIHSGLEEFRLLQLNEFVEIIDCRGLSEDAWSQMQSLPNGISPVFSLHRSSRSISIDICNCVNDSRGCPSGPRGPPGQPGLRGENGQPGQRLEANILVHFFAIYS